MRGIVDARADRKLLGRRANRTRDEARLVRRPLVVFVDRLASVTGPHPSPATFLGLLLTRLREAESRGGVDVAIADATRDFIDVRDAAAAIVAAGLASVTAEAINVGSGVATTVRELVTRFVAVAGVSPEVVREQDTPVRGLGGDWMQVDITHAERALGWRPRIDLTTSLRDTWLAVGPGLR